MVENVSAASAGSIVPVVKKQSVLDEKVQQLTNTVKSCDICKRTTLIVNTTQVSATTNKHYKLYVSFISSVCWMLESTSSFCNE